MLNMDYELTLEEEGMLQNPANLFSLIKTLQFILSAYNNSQIDDETYEKELNSISEKIENTIKAFPEYEGLDKFIKKYKLEDCTFAINYLKESKDKKPSKNIGIPPELIMKITQFFNDLSLFLDSENQSVSDIVPNYHELCISLEDLQKYINLQNDNISKVKQCYENLKNNRKASDILSDEEKNKMKMDLSVAYITVKKLLGIH